MKNSDVSFASVKPNSVVTFQNIASDTPLTDLNVLEKRFCALVLWLEFWVIAGDRIIHT